MDEQAKCGNCGRWMVQDNPNNIIYTIPDDVCRGEPVCMRARAEAAERRLQEQEQRIVGAERRIVAVERERGEARAAYEEMERWRDGALDEERKARAALAECGRAIDRLQKSASEAGDVERALLLERATHEETRRQAAAMREALETALREEWVANPAMRRSFKGALAGDAGRGYLAPSGTPGRVAVEVADGIAWLGTTVYVLHRDDEDDPLELCEGTVSDVWVDSENPAGPAEISVSDAEAEWEPEPARIYLDRARCIAANADTIRATVLALSAERRAQVLARLTRTPRALSLMAHAAEVVAAADPDVLLAALQEVTRG